MVARTAEAGSAPKSMPLTVARPPSEVEDLLQILQSDLLEEGPPTCILSPEGEMVYANKAYHRLAGPLAEAGAAPSQSGIGLMSPAGDLSPIAVSPEHKLTLDGRPEYYRARPRLLRGSGGSGPAPPLPYKTEERRVGQGGGKQ